MNGLPFSCSIITNVNLFIVHNSPLKDIIVCILLCLCL